MDTVCVQSPCHLVLSTRRVLATVLTILLQCFLSAVTSLSSASFIPVTSCISSIHFLLGRPLLLPSPNASIILFSSSSDRITCPKNPSFLLSAVCCSVSSSSIPISMRTLSLVFFSVHNILFIFLHIHISHALIKQILNRTLDATYRSYLVRQFSEMLTIESVYVSDTTTTTITTTNAPKPPCPFPLCLRGCPPVRGPDGCLHCVCLDCQVNYMMWIATFILLYSLHVNSLWR